MSGTAATPDVIAAGCSPLAPRALRDLFFVPRRFFAHPLELLHRPETTFVAWVAGMAGEIERIRQSLGPSSNDLLIRSASQSWIAFWLLVPASAILVGWLFWHVLGWWYSVRLKWSGATYYEYEVARGVNAYQTFVAAAPLVLWMLAATFVVPNYAAIHDGGGWWAAIPTVFALWSCVTTYVAATTAFPTVNRRRALLWFFALPLLFHTPLVLSAFE